MRVREDQVLRPDGQPGIYGVVEARIATGVIALSAEQKLYLVGQYRYPTQSYSWEIIEGGTEDNESPLVAAQRELREEAGLVAEQWLQLGGKIHLSNCITAECGYLYLARKLKNCPRSPDGTEVLELRQTTLAEAFSMLDSGEITDAMSIIALLRLERLLHNNELSLS